MNIYRIMRGKCKCYIAHNSYKIHNVEKMFWGDTEVYVLQKWFLNHINEIPPHGGRELISHAISLHPLSIRNIHRKNMWKYQYEDRCSPLKLQMCIKTIKKCTFHMPHNCWQMNYVKKICIGGIEHYIYCKIYLWSISMKCFPCGIHLPCNVTLPMIYAKHFSCK